MRKRKGKKWGPGNPLYDWKYGKKRSNSKKKGMKSMVRRRKARTRTGRRSTTSLFSLNSRGIIGKMLGFGPLGQVAGGLIASESLKLVGLNNNEIARAGAGFLGGGLIGAGTSYVVPNPMGLISGKIGGSSSNEFMYG